MDYRGQGYRPAQPKKTRQTPGRAKAKPAARRRKKRASPLGTFAVLVVFALLATAGTMGYLAYDEVTSVEKRNTFYRGVYVDDVPLYGATPQEAYDYVLGRARSDLAGWSVTLQYGSDMQWTVTTDMLGMTESLEAVVAEEINRAFAQGRTGNLLERYQTIQRLKTEPYKTYTSDIQHNESQLDALLSSIKARVDVAPEDARMELNFTRQNPIVIYGETVGRSLDIAKLKAQIQSMVNGMQAGTIQIEPDVLQPAVTEAQLSTKIVKLADFSTPIASYSTPERNTNIEVGCSAFHGHEIKAGEKVSFNKWTGTRTKENGYKEALEIVYGEYQMGTGGGICQVSSTLYNAVIEAGLEVVDRTGHALKSNYIAMGADCTVADRGIDFVFRNNTGESIYIVARLRTSGGSKSCVFQIYGRPDPNGYSYSLDHETIEEIPIPEKEVTVKDTKAEYVIYTDQTKTVKGSVGYRVRTYLVTRDSAGSIVSREELYVDTYKATPNKVYVGVTPRG